MQIKTKKTARNKLKFKDIKFSKFSLDLSPHLSYNICAFRRFKRKESEVDMPNQRKAGKKRVDFFLDEEERRVFTELKARMPSNTMSEALRYMLEKAAIANGITPPRRMPDDTANISTWALPSSGTVSGGF